MSNARDVLVSGAGIAGLAVSRALHRSGIAVTTLERRAEPADAGLAINLPGNAVVALGRLGLAADLSRLGRPVRRREYRTARDRLLFAVDETAFWGDDAQPRCVRRRDLLTLLGGDLPAEIVRRNCGVESVRQDLGGVEVGLTDGSTLTGGLLVGADGVRSTVRRAVLPGTAAGAALLAASSWRFMVPDPGVECWTLWAGARGMVLLIPLGDGEVYGWATARGAPAGGGDDTLRALAADLPDVPRAAVEASVARSGGVHHSPLEETRIPRWSDGRVVLIGDAAHATAPVWAQGAALGLEDALALAELLADRADWDGVGSAYERARRSRVAHVQAMTDRMSRAARLPPRLAALLMPWLGPRSYHATYGPLRHPTGP